jgi:hypothetical protein
MTNKDLLRQYADTGLLVTDHQIKIMPDGIFKTYIRKRLIAVENMGRPLSNEEMDRMSPDLFNYYIVKKLNRIKKGGGRDFNLTKYEYDKSTDDVKNEYLNFIIENKDDFSTWEFEVMNDDYKKRYLISLLNRVKEGGYGTQIRAAFPLTMPTPVLNKWQYLAVGEYLGLDVQENYIDERIKHAGNMFSDEEFLWLSDEKKSSIVNERVNNLWGLSSAMFNLLNDEQKVRYIKNELRIHNFVYPLEAKEYYKEHMKNNLSESLKRYREIIGYDK